MTDLDVEKLPACRVDPELFFPRSSADVDQVAAAKAICATCPLTRPCLEYALTNSVHGIWGGATEGERVALQRRHGLPVRVRWSTARTGASSEDPNPTDDDTKG